MREMPYAATSTTASRRPSTAGVGVHLRRRLGHDVATEDRTTARALRQIGLLALVRRVGG